MTRVGIYVDFSNLRMALKGHERMIARSFRDILLRFAIMKGKVVSRFIYIEPHEERICHIDEASNRGFRMVKCDVLPGDYCGGKSSVDATMMCDMMMDLYTQNVDHLVVVSADKDFLPALKHIVRYGGSATVVVNKDHSTDYVCSLEGLGIEVNQIELMARRHLGIA